MLVGGRVPPLEIPIEVCGALYPHPVRAIIPEDHPLNHRR